MQQNDEHALLRVYRAPRRKWEPCKQRELEQRLRLQFECVRHSASNSRERPSDRHASLTDKPTTGGSGGFGHEKSNVSASEEQVEACLGDLDKSPTRVWKGRISKKPAAAKPPPKAAKPAAKAPSKAAKPSGKASSKAKASPKAKISVSCCLERTRNNWQARTSVGDCRLHSSFSFGAGKAYATSSKAEAACKRHLDEFCKRNKVQCLGKRKSMVL